MALHSLAHLEHQESLARLVAEGNGHAGLEWDRYLPLWEDGGRRIKELYAPLDEFARRVNTRSRQDRQLPWLNERLERLRRAASAFAKQHNLAVASWEGILTWRLATGLGSGHPTENGFSFDHSTGLPVIAASSVKGLCRTAASLYDWSPQMIERLFGPAEIIPGSPGAIGEAIYFDSFPVVWPRVEVDIANSHHPDYYGDSGQSGPQQQKTPFETEDPNPVNFLVVGEGVRFLFTVLAPPNDAGRLEELLRHGLSDLGIGAKTAVGYGRFVAGSTGPTTSQR